MDMLLMTVQADFWNMASNNLTKNTKTACMEDCNEHHQKHDVIVPACFQLKAFCFFCAVVDMSRKCYDLDYFHPLRQKLQGNLRLIKFAVSATNYRIYNIYMKQKVKRINSKTHTIP